MFCNNCGAQISKDAKFCARCGKKFDAKEIAGNKPANSSEAGGTIQHSQKKGKLFQDRTSSYETELKEFKQASPVVDVKKVNKDWLHHNLWKLILATSVLLIAISAGYYLLIFLPKLQEQQTMGQLNYEHQQEQDKENAQQAQQEQIQQNNAERTLCMDEASDNYKTNWANACKYFGISNQGPNCTLPEYNANSVNSTLQQDQNNCITEYPGN